MEIVVWLKKFTLRSKIAKNMKIFEKILKFGAIFTPSPIFEWIFTYPTVFWGAEHDADVIFMIRKLGGAQNVEK